MSLWQRCYTAAEKLGVVECAERMGVCYTRELQFSLEFMA